MTMAIHRMSYEYGMMRRVTRFHSWTTWNLHLRLHFSCSQQVIRPNLMAVLVSILRYSYCGTYFAQLFFSDELRKWSDPSLLNFFWILGWQNLNSVHVCNYVARNSNGNGANVAQYTEVGENCVLVSAQKMSSLLNKCFLSKELFGALQFRSFHRLTLLT